MSQATYVKNKPLITSYNTMRFIGFFNVFLFLNSSVFLTTLVTIVKIRKLTSIFNNKNYLNRLILKKYTKQFFYYSIYNTPSFNTFNFKNNFIFNYYNYFLNKQQLHNTLLKNTFLVPYSLSTD